MNPPQWAVNGGTRLDLDSFTAEFSHAWSELKSRFLKVECWQSYQESESNRSQLAFNTGDVRLANELLQDEAEAERPLYEDIRSRKIEFARIRVIQQPVTQYLRYELMSYRIRAAMGENVEVVRIGSDISVPNDEIFDFLLFDRDLALVHDYGQGATGVQTGGWLVRDVPAVRMLESRALSLRREAEPLERFARETNP